MQIGAAYPWRQNRGSAKKLKVEQPYDPAIQLLGIYPKELKSRSWKDASTPMFIAALFTMPICRNNLNAQDRWMD